MLVITGTWSGSDAGTTELKVCTKRAASYSLSDLAGTWGLNSLASGPGAPWWLRGTLTLDAAGHYTMSAVDSEGEPDSVSGAISLLGDGSFAINEVPGGRFRMDAGKTVVVCTTTWLTGGSDNGTTSLSVSLKKAASYSSADLVGDWDCNSLATGPGEPWWERATITIGANGAFSGSATDSSLETYPINGAIVLSDSGFAAPLIPGQFLLTAGASGNGGGTISSGDGRVFFSYPTNDEGIAGIDQGATVTLSAIADNLSTASWFGDCSSTGGSTTVATCTITSVNDAKSVSALFTRRTVRIAETSAYYTLIQTAYDEATNDQTVQIQATDFNENLILANPEAVSLKGGFNADFSTNSDWTTVTGTVTISGAPVTVENIAIL